MNRIISFVFKLYITAEDDPKFKFPFGRTLLQQLPAQLSCRSVIGLIGASTESRTLQQLPAQLSCPSVIGLIGASTESRTLQCLHSLAIEV
jgi:hypothetical protein